MASPSEVTELLLAWGRGDETALARLTPLVHDELRRMARRHMAGERAGHTLQTSALVNEAYLRLVDLSSVGLKNRAHFFALAAQLMRRVLVDHARARKAQKRGAGKTAPELEPLLWIPQEDLDAVAELDEALRRLEALDERQCRILEQRYFGGLSLEETASALGVSLATVKRELRSALAWLALQLDADPVL